MVLCCFLLKRLAIKTFFPGYGVRSAQIGASGDIGDGVMLLNFIADYWDLVDTHKASKASSSKTRPSCSVIIKHLKDKGDILFAHNAWHEYRAMAYRSGFVP